MMKELILILRLAEGAEVTKRRTRYWRTERKRKIDDRKEIR